MRALTLSTAACLLVGCGDAAPSSDASAASEPATATTSDRNASASGTGSPSGRVRPTLDAAQGYAVAAREATIDIRDEPRGDVVSTLENPRPSGAPLTFLLAADAGNGWLQVLLPVRPNGSTGWVRRSEVTVSEVPYRLEMSTATHTLSLYEDGELVETFPAASGTGDTPTPTGTFYLTELIEPTNSGYGPYAYGLSGFSEVLSSFGGGPGQIGLHGTDDPGSVGRAVSHGCIRLSNPDITRLAKLLPLGTPVVIT